MKSHSSCISSPSTQETGQPNIYQCYSRLRQKPQWTPLLFLHPCWPCSSQMIMFNKNIFFRPPLAINILLKALLVIWNNTVSFQLSLSFGLSCLLPAYTNYSSGLLLRSLTLLLEIIQFLLLCELHEEFPVHPSWSSVLLTWLATQWNCGLLCF